jgi:DNA-binding CsgD family transcriptional regulator
MGRQGLLRSAVLALAEQGKTRKEIIEITGASYPTIKKYLKQAGIEVPHHRQFGEALDRRDRRMCEMYKQGLSLREIGEKYGVTRELVRQAISKHGIRGTDGGPRKSSAERKALRRAELNARYLTTHGLTVDQYRELRDARITRVFQKQKSNAGDRGIDWSLTLGQWFAIWQESGKLHLRGRGKGRYVMSRFGDLGAYEVGNVFIQLSTDNNREGVKKTHAKRRSAAAQACMQA